MKKRMIIWAAAAALAIGMFGGCGAQSAEEAKSAGAELSAEAEETDSAAEEETAAAPEDGVYTASFDTDSTMFHVNEANDGCGTLTVENGEMTIHVSLTSKNIVNLFAGTAEDAQNDGAELLQPTTDTVTYSDGTSEEVYGFDIPVPALDTEFDVALIGTKGVWYDHKVSVSVVESAEEDQTEAGASDAAALEAGTYSVNVALSGGSGKATVESPAQVIVEEGQAFATIVWSSTHYDYMIVNGEKYLNTNEGGNSTFTIPIDGIPCEMTVIGDTTAMSTPHEIEYTLTFTE